MPGVRTLERSSIVLGLLLVALGVAAFDWRNGLIVGGLLLVGIAIDPPTIRPPRS